MAGSYIGFSKNVDEFYIREVEVNKISCLFKIIH